MYHNFHKEMENELTLGEEKEIVNHMLLKTLGMSYYEFIQLDFDEQQKIIRQYHEKTQLKIKVVL